MKYEKWRELKCFECGGGINCTDNQGFSPPREGEGRILHKNIIPVSKHGVSVENCPSRKFIRTELSKESLLGKIINGRGIREEGFGKIDIPTEVDGASSVLLRSKVL